jgi:molybdenum cofactor biosynthesis enzyme MoaA
MTTNAGQELNSITNEESLCIEVTTHCNGECHHCFVHTEISERSKLPVDLVKEIISEGYTTGFRNLHITGGEPLLWEGLFDALDFAFDLGYQTVFLNTNGTLLAQDINRQLADYAGLSISVSLDGPEMLHE